MNVVTAIGAVLGVLAFAWRLWDQFGSYLHLELVISPFNSRYALAKAVIENKGHRPKRLTAVYLLLGPFEEGPIATYNKIADENAKPRVDSTNAIEFQDIDRTLATTKRTQRIMPMPFFTHENITIGDERVTFTVPIQLDGLEKGDPYSVRLLAYGPRRLHRTVQDLLLADDHTRASNQASLTH